MHGGSLKKFCPPSLSVFSWFSKNGRKQECEWRAVAPGIFQISSPSTRVATSIRSFAAYPHRPFRVFIKSTFPLSSVPYLNLITMSAEGADSSHDLTAIRWGQSALASDALAASWKNPRARTKKRRRTKNPSWISALPPFAPFPAPAVFPGPCKPGTRR